MKAYFIGSSPETEDYNEVHDALEHGVVLFQL